MSLARRVHGGPVRDEADNAHDTRHQRDGAEPMNDLKPRATWFDDAHQIIDVTRERPGLPIPTISPARATFDYRHITHSEVARESVARAVAVLGEAFGVTFTPGTGTAGDDTPRYL